MGGVGCSIERTAAKAGYQMRWQEYDETLKVRQKELTEEGRKRAFATVEAKRSTSKEQRGRKRWTS